MGKKHVCVHGKEDKRQVIVVVSSIAEGVLMPLQVVFTSKIFKSLSKSNEGCQLCKGLGWDLTTSPNHWSTLQTCKDFVRKSYNLIGLHKQKS